MEPQPIGCQAVAWVTRETLTDYPFPAADDLPPDSVARLQASFGAEVIEERPR